MRCGGAVLSEGDVHTCTWRGRRGRCIEYRVWMEYGEMKVGNLE